MVIFEGKYHLLITTRLLETNNGCIAYLVSENADMTDYTDLGLIMEWQDDEAPECPDYFEMDGRIVLE